MDRIERALRALPDQPGLRVRVALLLRKRRQLDLARAIGLHETQFNRCVNGHEQFTDEHLRAAAEWLDVQRGALGRPLEAVTR